MTDRINSITIALEKDIRVDDAESLIAAIYHMKGVLRIEQNITDPSSWVAETRAKHEMREKIYEALK